ncbi:MAG: hypothetical protein ACO1OT_18945 [Heyndrickxia sp.]
MSEENEKKKTKTLHVDTLHIHANEVVFHQERPEGAAGPFAGPFGAAPFAGPTGPVNAGNAPEGPAEGPGNGPQQIQRDFWGFPIRPMQAPGNQENAGEGGEGNQNNDGAQQGPPPGWI